MAAGSGRRDPRSTPDPRGHSHGHHQAGNGIPEVLLSCNGEYGRFPIGRCGGSVWLRFEGVRVCF